MKYGIKHHRFGIPSAKAQEVGEAIEAITKRTGSVAASDVVDEAANECSALHPYFEWDDIRAAQLFREEQARGIMRSIVVVVDTGKQEEEVRAFHCVQTESEESEPERRYVTLGEQAKDLSCVLNSQREVLAEDFRGYLCGMASADSFATKAINRILAAWESR